MSNTHTCHVPTCDEPVPPRMLMCRRHWFLVPDNLRRAVWQHYRPGQEIDKNPSSEWMGAATRAIATVVEREKQNARDRERQMAKDRRP